MSVYTKDGAVLVQSGAVATSSDCCCSSDCCNLDNVIFGRCSLCKLCLGPHNTCNCGSGDFDCGHVCIDGITAAQCCAFVPQGFSTSFLAGGVCTSTTACDAWSGGCAHTGLGMCCDEVCDCLSGISQADCFGFGGTCWNEDCLCNTEGGLGCGICYDSCGTGACCVSIGTCMETTSSACIGLGGWYAGDFTTCPNAVCCPA